MTATISKTYDVFVSHAASDSHVATEIADIQENAFCPSCFGCARKASFPVCELAPER